MKHLLKIPQKKTKCYVSYLEKPVKIGLNEIKINKFYNGFNIECHLPVKMNEQSISIIEELDNISLNTLKENPDWFEDTDKKWLQKCQGIYRRFDRMGSCRLPNGRRTCLKLAHGQIINREKQERICSSLAFHHH